MRLRSRVSIAAGVLFLGAAALYWTSKAPHDLSVAEHLKPEPGEPGTRKAASATATSGTNEALLAAAAAHDASAAARKSYRLSNSTRPKDQLDRDSRVVGLRNAVIDTGSSAKLEIPESLKSDGNPGSYLIHARHGMDPAFYRALQAAGAEFVSYIPNDTALVKATASVADQLGASAGVDSVLPYEPYYKLDTSLLPVALGDQPLTSDFLAVTAYPSSRDALRQRLQSMGIEPVAEDRTPFGSLFIVKADQAFQNQGTQRLVALAQEPLVQAIEPSVRRMVLNDLTRPRIGVAIDSLVATNYQLLTGSNVIVAVNDTGVDATHPDLKKRVFAAANSPSWVLTDDNSINTYDNGHGTHVAGIIAGDGSESVTVSNAPGSVRDTNGNYVVGQFRGMAPAAKLFVQPIDVVTGPLVSDAYLQESAWKSNAFICNNSWGYMGQFGYTMSSASYDAATRDAVPETNGSQPLLFVFAAGNQGAAGDGGTGGRAGSILAPATAKNVITVGALEAFRNITNEVHFVDGTNTTTNLVWAKATDSDFQVARFSSRGNVGIGLEGQFGRFKPDVVAPGVFAVSTRSTNWIDPVAEATVESIFDRNRITGAGSNTTNVVTVPSSGVVMLIQLLENAHSPEPFPTNLMIFADPNPNTPTQRTNQFDVTPGDWWIRVLNTNSQPVAYDLAVYILVTNAQGDTFDVLKGINDKLAPFYRFESGTSMAAPAVSGMLALMQEYFVETLKLHPSPALMKALLINGASQTAKYYDYQVNKMGGNDEGWGLANVANSLPPGLTTNGPLLFFDQSTNGALATGDSCVRNIHLSDDATNAPLRVTLVWTDPPGNPAAGIKLVNDLDLIVSNKVTKQVYIGNNFPALNVYTQGSTNLTGTNAIPSDIVNNVENVYISGGADDPVAGDYAVIVKGKRVNVNAVTSHTNDIVQDYALVISSGLAAVTVTNPPIQLLTTLTESNKSPWVVNLTNGVPALYQRVGANSPLLGGTNGTTNQWRFYVFTNMPAPTNITGLTNPPPTNQPYVAIVTFMSPNLSTPRNFDADIDLYVTTNSLLTNLDDFAVLGSDKSLKRGGSEMILYSNSVMGMVYYIGVKSEDQKAAEFGILAVASDKPFSSTDSDGNIVARAIGLPMALPDGTPTNPHQTNILCLSTDLLGRMCRRVGVRERIEHRFAGDIYESLGQGSASDSTQVWLLNHSDFGSNQVEFDDSAEVRGSVHSDGPGNLRNFVGQPASGMWMTTIWDNASGDEGVVTEFSMVIAPQPFDPYDFYVTLHAGGWYFDFLDLPTDVTNLNISIGFVSGTGPVDLVLRKGDFPTLTTWDHSKLGIQAPGDALNVGTNDVPPISDGRWFYGLHNGSQGDVTLHVVIKISRRMVPDLIQTYIWTNGPTGLFDDARTQSTLFVPERKPVLATSVGVRLDHARASDLAITLTSPQGTRVMLFEDRGGTNPAGLGLSLSNSLTSTSVVYTVFTENTNWAPQPIKFAVPPYGSTKGVLTANYILFTSGFETNSLVDTNGITMTNGVWDYTATNTWGLTNPPGIYTNGQLVDGWLVVSNLVITNLVVTNSVTNLVVTNIFITNAVCIVQDVTNSVPGSTNFLTLGNGRLMRDVVTEPGKPYRLTYAYRGQGLTNWWPADTKVNDLIGPTNGTEHLGVTYGPGEVTNAWQFDGSGQNVSLGTNVGNFGTNDFTIDFWLKAALIPDPALEVVSQGVINKRAACGLNNFWGARTIAGQPGRNGSAGFEVCEGGPDTWTLVLGRTRVDDSKWHHVAFTRKGVYIMVYIDGEFNEYAVTPHVLNLTNNVETIVGTSACVGSDTTQPLTGGVDELDFFQRALSPSEISAIYQAGSLGKYSSFSPVANARVVVNGVTNYVFGNDTVWATNSIAFLAATNVTRIELIGSAAAPLLDTIRFEELANTNYGNFFLAEESLDAFKGEMALGYWTLNLWDTRSGMASTNNSLLSWELQLTYSSTNVAMVTLTNRVAYTNTIASNSISYFAIDVPINARFATNMLFSLNPGDPLDLLYNQTGLPTGNLPGDAPLLVQVGTAGGTNVLNTTSLPFLVPGQRYFLGINNLNPTPEDFRLEVDFDVTTNIDFTMLTNGIPATNNIVGTNTIPTNIVAIARTNIQYYAFDVSTNATLVTFELFGMTNDLDLIVSKGLPVPTLKNFDYLSANAGTNSELIAVSSNSIPVPLSPGRWYMGVLGYKDTNSTPYEVRATEWIATLVTLTNLMPYTNFVSSNYSRFFAVDVPANAISVTNLLRTTNGERLNLFYSTTGLPTTNSTLLFTANPSGSKVLSSNSTPLLVPGQRYYLWVAQTNNVTPQPFTIEVDFELPPIQITALTNAIPFTNAIAVNSSDYYSFNVSTNNPVRVQFDVFNNTGDVDLYLRRALPVPNDQNWDYRSANSGSPAEQIILVTNSSPIALAPGIWYLDVTNVDSIPVTYTVRASEWDWNTNTVILTNGLGYTTIVPSNSIAYFAVDVPLLVDAVTNTLRSISGEKLDLLFSQIGSPIGVLPGDYTLFSTAGVISMSDVLATEPWPASDPILVPNQRYYLGVKNANPTAAQFAIQVDFESKITLLTNGIGFTNSLVVGGSPIQYYAFEVSTNAGAVVFEIPSTTGDVGLVARQAIAGAPPMLPAITSYDYRSDNPGTNAESIVVLTNSTPVPLMPGMWYLAVYPNGGATADYTIRATEWAGAQPPVNMTNNAPVNGTLPPNSLRFFAITVPTNALAVNNRLICTGDPLDLFFNQNTQPMGLPGDTLLVTGTSDGTKVLNATSTPVLVPGATYYLTVRNTHAISEPFSLRVSMDLMVVLTNAVAYTNSINAGGEMQYYAFLVAPTASRAAFEILNPDGNVDMVLQHGLPLPTMTNYGLLSGNPGSNAESVVLTTDSATPVQLTPGWWYIGVYNAQPTNLTNAVTYRIRAIQEVAVGGPMVVPLTAGTNFSSSALPGASFFTNNEFIYYTFDVVSDEPRLTFSITNATGDLDMLVMWFSEPRPNSQWFDFSGTVVGGAGSVTIQSDPNSIWPSLNGTWYVAVPNWTASNVNFDITAASYTTRALRIIDLTNATPYSTIAGPRGVTDGNGDPILYRFTITSNDSAVIFNLANTQGGDVGLLASPDVYPTLGTPSFSSFNLSPTNDVLLVMTNSSLTSLNSQWYLAVTNGTDTPVSFDIMATLLTPPAAFTPIMSVQPSQDGYVISWPTYPGMEYELDYTPDLNLPFTLLTTMIAPGQSLIYTDPTPQLIGAPQGYYRLRLLGMPGSGLFPPTFP